MCAVRHPKHTPTFICELDKFVWQNPDHLFVLTLSLRIDLALLFISGPITATWKKDIQQNLLLDAPVEMLWDEFLDVFCETWVYSSESASPTNTPAVNSPTITPLAPYVDKIPTDTLSSHTTVSTPKRVEDLPITLAAEEPSLPSDLDMPTPADLDSSWPLLIPLISPSPVDVPVLSWATDTQTATDDTQIWPAEAHTSSDLCILTTRIGKVPLSSQLHAYAVLVKRMLVSKEREEQPHRPRELPCTQLAHCSVPLPQNLSDPDLDPARPHGTSPRFLPAYDAPATTTIEYNITNIAFTPLSPRLCPTLHDIRDPIPSTGNPPLLKPPHSLLHSSGPRLLTDPSNALTLSHLPTFVSSHHSSFASSRPFYSILSALALPDECPPSPPIVNSNLLIDFLKGNDDNAFLATHPPDEQRT
ncbi:hypothetical protein EDB92DRAFT_1943997 [Lactarius akahatsu]|uniref:Uncharacterized protein n=1 Tax=Lactarius akahatsu TaxID=416441 RepID=A0AAD4LKM4_9AGAM|nr:hypothetical protein EDB92DRAFT_1943997 [Lactarius akahatsu]